MKILCKIPDLYFSPGISMLFVFPFLLISATCFGQSASDTTALIEQVFQRYQTQHPGCQFSVNRNGKLIFSKAWGTADLEHGVPLTLNSVIEAGSVSKQFTAAAVLLLEQQGKLSLNDDVRKYLPELPDYGRVIKIKHLIHHTSGIKDWGSIAGLTGWGRGSKTYTNQDALEIAARQQTLNNLPGAEFIYSNSNYNLLAIIVQRVSGLSLSDFTHKYIFIPAGMDDTQWRDDYRRVVKNRSIAYEKTDGAYRADMPNEYAYGNGGLLTTSQDLLKWNAFYWSGRFGIPSLLDKQIALDTLNNGLSVYYGAGLFIQTHNGLKVIRHTGATGSYRCYLGYYPELKLSMAWISNTSEFDEAKNEVVLEVEKILLPKKQASPATSVEKQDSIVLPLAKLQSYQGWYRNTMSDRAMQILWKEGKLLFDGRTPLKPINDGVFKLGSDNLVTFNKDGFKLINGDKDTASFTVAKPAVLRSDVLKVYAGQYFSRETRSWITISLSDGNLKLDLDGKQSFLLVPTYQDGFVIKGIGSFAYFDKSTKGFVKLYISQSRARKVVFEKLTKSALFNKSVLY